MCAMMVSVARTSRADRERTDLMSRTPSTAPGTITLLDSPAEDTQTELRPLPTDRDDLQRHLDGRYATVLSSWQEAGKPAPEASPFDRVTVAKAHASAVKGRIRAAARQASTKDAKYDVRFFKDFKDEHGNVTIKYVPVDRPVPAPASQDGQGSSE